MKSRRWLAILALMVPVSVAAAVVWSAGSPDMGAGDVRQLITLDRVVPGEAPVERLRIVVVDAEYAVQLDPSAPRWPSPATYRELVETLAHEIALLHPDVLVVFDVMLDRGESGHVNAAEAIAIEGDMTFRREVASWSSRYALWPGWRPSESGGRVRAGHVVYSRLPMHAEGAAIGEDADTASLAGRVWGPHLAWSHVSVEIGGGRSVDVVADDGAADAPALTDVPGAIVVRRPPAEGMLTDDEGNVGLALGPGFTVLRPMTHSRLNGSVRGTMLYIEVAVDLDAPADGSGDTGDATETQP